MHAHVSYVSVRVSAASAAFPAPTHPSIKEAAFGRLHKGGAAFGRPPLWIPLWMGVWGLGKQQAQQNLHKYKISHRGRILSVTPFRAVPSKWGPKKWGGPNN